jgi:predicted methyltransferase
MPEPQLSSLHPVADKAGILTHQLLELLEQLKWSPRLLDLTRATGLAQSVIRIVRGELSELITVSGDIHALSPAGKQFMESLNAHLAAKTQGQAVKEASILSLLRAKEESRPRSDRSLDQFRCTPETSLNRAKLLAARHQIEGRRIAVLGDNDLTSLAIGALDKPARVAVFDIDGKVLDQIAASAETLAVAPERIPYDARTPLPAQQRASFDLVVTDPPYTTNGVALFLSRSCELLTDQGCIYLSYGYSLRARERALAVQQVISRLGLLIAGTWPNFNEYCAAGSIGARSHLYLLLCTPQTKPLIKGHFKEAIYTNEVGQEEAS